MPKLISAKHHLDKLIVECVADNGDRLLRCGGSLAWRFNNPGNLRPPESHPPRYTKNFIGIGDSANKLFFIFPDYATGRAELKAHLLRKHSAKPIPEAMKAYAPSNENKTAEYTAFVLKETQLPKDKLIGKFTPTELESFMSAIEKFEGYHKDKETRQEKWVRTTTVSVTNGARPIANKELVLRKGGVEVPVKTNATGKLPPIVHSPKEGPIELLVRNAKNELESLLKIMPDSPSKMLQLVFDSLTVTAPTATHTPPSKQQKTAREPIKYVVKAGDTISKIASRFKLSADDIKKTNPQIKDINKIFPGQIVYLYGNAPAPKPQTQQRPAPINNGASNQKNVGKDLHAQNPITKTGPRAASAPSKPSAQAEPDAIDTFTDWLNGLLGRSNNGQGKPLAVIPPAPTKQAPWMVKAVEEAMRWAGQEENEITKEANYHRLVDPKKGLKTLVGGANPWCASFVNYCLKQAGYAVSSAPASSQSFMSDKNFVKIKQPVYGAIMVWTNYVEETGKNMGSGHVAFFYGSNAALGGNQSDGINFRPPGDIRWYDKKNKRWVQQKFRGYYVPTLYAKQAESDEEKAFSLEQKSSKELNKAWGLKEAGTKTR